MLSRRLETSLYASLLFTVLGLLAWSSGQPFIFPSLGPSAFVLSLERQAKRRRSVRIVASHAIGAAAGLVAYGLIANGVVLTVTPAPLSESGFRLAVSAVLSIALTSWAMIATDTCHPPACATTLIVSLGLLSTIPHAVTIVVAVAILVGAHHLARWGWNRCLRRRWMATAE